MRGIPLTRRQTDSHLATANATPTHCVGRQKWIALKYGYIGTTMTAVATANATAAQDHNATYSTIFAPFHTLSPSAWGRYIRARTCPLPQNFSAYTLLPSNWCPRPLTS